MSGPCEETVELQEVSCFLSRASQFLPQISIQAQLRAVRPLATGSGSHSYVPCRHRTSSRGDGTNKHCTLLKAASSFPCSLSCHTTVACVVDVNNPTTLSMLASACKRRLKALNAGRLSRSDMNLDRSHAKEDENTRE